MADIPLDVPVPRDFRFSAEIEIEPGFDWSSERAETARSGGCWRALGSQ
tara:strand:+ start:194 stop:340 length:147 start_codon:yes stop_codon:yes gene_type:complete